MLVNRKTIITNITFTKEEVEMFKNLKKVISECCNSFSECSRGLKPSSFRAMAPG